MKIRSNLGWKHGILLIVDGVLVSNGSLYLSETCKRGKPTLIWFLLGQTTLYLYLV